MSMNEPTTSEPLAGVSRRNNVSRRLEGQVALVTGAATGIGAAIARRFREEGAQVAAAGLQAAELGDLASGIGALAIECDITDERSVRAMIDKTLAQYGELNIVVNAAGVIVTDDVESIEDDAWRMVFDVNLEGTMRVCRAAIPALKRSGGGAIINIASVAAFNSNPGKASYSASKAAVIALTRAIANHNGPDGIRANCLCPGLIRTPMAEAEMDEIAAARGISSEEAWAQIAAQSSLKRVALPEDIAGCALFLASEDAALVTGATLVAGGGGKIPPVARAI